MKSNGKNKEKLLTNLAQNGGNIWAACRAVGIVPSTFYEWKKNDAVFAEEYEKLKELQFDFVESKLFDLIDMNNPTAILFWLKCKGKDKGYIEKQEVKLETDGKWTLNIETE